MWDASLAPLLAEPLGPWRAAVSDLILAPFCGCDRNGLLYDGAAEPGSVPRTAPRRAREGAPVTAGSGLSPTVAAPSVEAQPLRARQQLAPRRASPGGHRAACRSRAVQPSPASWLRSSLLGSEAGFSKHWRPHARMKMRRQARESQVCAQPARLPTGPFRERRSWPWRSAGTRSPSPRWRVRVAPGRRQVLVWGLRVCLRPVLSQCFTCETG